MIEVRSAKHCCKNWNCPYLGNRWADFNQLGMGGYTMRSTELLPLDWEWLGL